jgi:uncharacterized protein HemX
MEEALRDGLRGRGPTATEAAWSPSEDDTASTQMLSRTRATTAMPPRARRQLQPIDEPTPPPRRPPARRQSAPPPVAPRRRSGGGIGRWIALLLVLALVGGGLAAYQAVNGTTAKSVQLRKDVSGRVDRAAQELRALIEENTQ